MVGIRHSRIRDYREKLEEEEQAAEALLKKISNLN